MKFFLKCRASLSMTLEASDDLIHSIPLRVGGIYNIFKIKVSLKCTARPPEAHGALLLAGEGLLQVGVQLNFAYLNSSMFLEMHANR
jgi:hypothetical protein